MKKFLSFVSWGVVALFLTVSTAARRMRPLRGRLAMGPAHRSPGRVLRPRAPDGGRAHGHY